MKKLMCIIGACLILALPLAGCNNGGYLSPQLEELLNRSNEIHEIKYSLVITYTVQRSGNHAGLAEGAGFKNRYVMSGRETVILADMVKKPGYIYIPVGGIATRTDFDDIPSTIKTDMEAAKKYSPVIVGNEMIDGKLCTVVTYRDGGTDVKAWIWDDYGIFIKRELKDSGRTALIELEGIDFSEIPASVFELPEGVLRSDWMDETPAN
jgi:hypothetical protein